jgi:D-tyrosyl-tRNA(Tyr) deacylase
VIALLQRVSEASVVVKDQGSERLVGAIGHGLAVLVAVERGDSEAQADRLLQRLLAYRVFDDAQGRMNLDLRQVSGELLLVSQFTLAADTGRGNRPSFTPAAEPAEGRRLFDYLLHCAQRELGRCASGEFGAHMVVRLSNDGPVTFRLQVSPFAPAA